MAAPYLALAEPLSQKSAPASGRYNRKALALVALLSCVVGVALWTQLAGGEQSSSTIDMIAGPVGTQPSMLMSPRMQSASVSNFMSPMRDQPLASHVTRATQLQMDPPIWNPFVKKGHSKHENSYSNWAEEYRAVLNSGLKPLDSFEAEKMIEDQGAVVVDVRPDFHFQKFGIENAISLPLFRAVAGNSMKDHMKRAMGASLAVTSTERNPDFATQAYKLLPRDKPIIIACDRGGRLDMDYEEAAKVEVSPMVKMINSWTTPLMPKTSTKDFDRHPNRYTTSLKAAYELSKLGFTNLYYLEEGMKQWERDGLPLLGAVIDDGNSREDVYAP